MTKAEKGEKAQRVAILVAGFISNGESQHVAISQAIRAEKAIWSALTDAGALTDETKESKS